MSGLRILHTVEFYDPSVGGAQAVVGQISRRLAQRGHEVTVATTRLPGRASTEIDGVHVEEFDISGNAVHGMRGDVAAYRDFVLGGDFDVLMSYAVQQWTADALLPVIDQVPYGRTLAPCGFSGLHDPAYAGYFRELPAALAKFDRLIFHSPTYQDARFSRDAGLSNMTVIPNAADEREFGDLPAGAADAFRARHGIDRDVPLVLTVGGHTGEKGHALAIEALRRTELERAVLVIVGNRPLGRGCTWSCRARAIASTATSGGRKRVLLLDLPRAETLAAYAAADLFVFASAIECSPLVLFESAASGTPFVTLDVGNSAEIAGWTGAGDTVTTQRRSNGRATGRPEDIAAAIDGLLGDPARRARMGEEGRRVWRERYTWDTVAHQYEQLYGEVVAARAAGAR